MEELVSIIVPIYNVEKYLSKCIDSIVNQTYKNIEIILVDDGSTDNSLSICKLYECREKRINLIHKKNGGLSEARNFGIKNAKGKYITFIDSDDWIDSKFVEMLMGPIKLFNADLVVSRLFDTNNYSKNIKNKKIEYEIIDKENAFYNILLQKKFDVSACGKLYRTDIFDKLKYPVGELYEDFQIIEKVIELSSKIVYTSYVGYYYYNRPGSIVHSSFSNKRMTLIDSSRKLIDYIEINYPKLKEAAIRRYIYSNYVILGFSINSKPNKKNSLLIRSNILNYKKMIYHNKYFSIKDRIATFLLSLGLNPYRYFLNLYKKIQYIRGK